ncbi:hypothetical protein GCM10023149_50520 [Mucilaginibacter gynuensis]|uniref:Uncharacterized protein n=1 Tax=Mucilaginibacter gynuensis TaxID=1302236 RepID=A0ABP8HI31_9SPHI
MTDSLTYDYIKLVLERDFPSAYLRFSNNGMLHYELTNMVEVCAPLTRGLDREDEFLKAEVIGIISAYLEEA